MPHAVTIGEPSQLSARPPRRLWVGVMIHASPGLQSLTGRPQKNDPDRFAVAAAALAGRGCPD